MSSQVLSCCRTAWSAAAAPLAAQSVKAGIEAWQHADYAGAVAIWRPLAEKGDADAAVQPRPGLSPRARRADQPRRGADLVRARREPGPCRCPDDARPAAVPERRPGRRAAMAQAGRANKGEPRALLVYGTALFNGDGVTQDPVLGYAYVSRAAAQGLAPAKETLAQLDKILPLADRKKGVALAMAKAKAAPRQARRHEKPSKPAQSCQAAAQSPSKAREDVCTSSRGAAESQRAKSRPAATGASSSALSRKRARPKRCFASFPASSALAGRQRFLYSGRRDHPAPGRAVREPRRGRSGVQTRSEQACFAVRSEIISRGTSRGGARPGPTARRRARDA